MPLSICVHDTHPLFLLALSSLLSEEPDFRLHGCFGAVADCRANVVEERPDVCVVDVADALALDLISDVVRNKPMVRFLALSASADGGMVYRALAAGASGYLLKTAPPEDIVGAIKRIADGGSVLSAELGDALARQISDQRGAVATLTEREREVLRHLCNGGSAADIGRQLFLGSATVRTHLSRIYEKLGVSGRAAAVAVAFRTGLID